ncbi:MAG TPA: hypothetical protein VGP70_27815 [Actinomadura sp.]|jgi:hypothetical protein|nr:hypothetical protein [Actinomadura sp.]
MTGTLRVPRSRGALSGVLLLLLGLWGGLVPFVGPYADFAYTPDRAWVFTTGRLWLEIVPAAATVLGGLILLLSANRLLASLGAWIAALGGAWFVAGGPVSALWTDGGAAATGAPIGSESKRIAEQLAFFDGVGVLIVFFAALALGRLAVVAVKDVQPAGEQAAAPPAPEDAPPIGATQPLPRRYARGPHPGDPAAPRPRGPEPGDRMVAPYASDQPSDPRAPQA